DGTSRSETGTRASSSQIMRRPAPSEQDGSGSTDESVGRQGTVSLSTTATTAVPGDGRVDLATLQQFSQWFPNFSQGGLDWNIDGSSASLANDSIDPNMLDAGLSSALVAAAAAAASNSDPNASVQQGLSANMDSGSMHTRRRSQFDWYGLTPSLAAALNPAENSTAMSSLNPFALTANNTSAAPASYRRPSMPIFPTFAYPQSDMLGMSATGEEPPDGLAASANQGVYSTDGPESTSMAAAAAAVAAAAVAVALGEGRSTEGIEPSADPSLLTTSSALPRRYTHSSGVPANLQPSGSVSGRQALSVGSDHARRSAGHGRRRTMHVPSSLLEGVATSEFGEFTNEMLSASAGTSNRQQRQQQQHEDPSETYPPRPATSAGLGSSAVTAGSTRVRRSRTIDANQAKQQRPTASATMQPPSAIPHNIQSVSSLSQLPVLTGQLQQPQPQILSMTGHQLTNVATTLGTTAMALVESAPVMPRHTRSYSGTQFTHDAMSVLIGSAPSLMSTDVNQMDLTPAGLSAVAQQQQQQQRQSASTSNTVQQHYLNAAAPIGGDSSMDAELELLTSMSASAAMESSAFKPSLWTSTAFSDDGIQGFADETQSLSDLRRDAGPFIDIYRPATSTPTQRDSSLNVRAIASGSNMMQASSVTGSQRHYSPGLATQSAPTVSPVAPRSAASTPGRRETVGI
ncbi:hypothetical protein EC988_003554, partial [Linderina pennispora]